MIYITFLDLFLAAFERDDEEGCAARRQPLPGFDVRHLGVN